MEEILEFVKDCGVYYLATVDDGKPRVRPFGTFEMFENHLYIETSKKKNVSKQIQKNPYVEICAYKGDKWIRISGKLVRDDRIEAKVDMLDKNPKLKELYSAYDDKTEVLYFESGEAVISSFGGEDRVIKF